jgi:hypothetical protein
VLHDRTHYEELAQEVKAKTLERLRGNPTLVRVRIGLRGAFALGLLGLGLAVTAESGWVQVVGGAFLATAIVVLQIVRRR